MFLFIYSDILFSKSMFESELWFLKVISHLVRSSLYLYGSSDLAALLASSYVTELKNLSKFDGVATPSRYFSNMTLKGAIN